MKTLIAAIALVALIKSSTQLPERRPDETCGWHSSDGEAVVYTSRRNVNTGKCEWVFDEEASRLTRLAVKRLKDQGEWR